MHKKFNDNFIHANICEETLKKYLYLFAMQTYLQYKGICNANTHEDPPYNSFANVNLQEIIQHVEC